MLKRRFYFVLCAAVVVFVGGLFAGSSLRRWFSTQSAPKVYTAPAVIQQVQTLSELVTVKYVIEKVEALEVPADSVLARIFSGENRVVMMAHGIVKAGFDLTKLGPNDVRITENKIMIKLPPPQITDAYLDDKQTKVIERTTGLLRSFDKDLEQNLRQNLVSDIQKAARDAGIFKDAEARAKAQLNLLLKQMGFAEVRLEGRW
jgi:hypothetical protein